MRGKVHGASNPTQESDRFFLNPTQLRHPQIISRSVPRFEYSIECGSPPFRLRSSTAVHVCDGVASRTHCERLRSFRLCLRRIRSHLFLGRVAPSDNPAAISFISPICDVDCGVTRRPTPANSCYFAHRLPSTGSPKRSSWSMTLSAHLLFPPDRRYDAPIRRRWY